MLNNVMCLTDRGQTDEPFKKGTWKKYLNSADFCCLHSYKYFIIVYPLSKKNASDI